ncbi:hypothetical protein M404DRAFT_423892 [Pisolithus tinctorius Marx 270]|uniref:Uncharacterized protein n=1 Tax=Pisolithus tinctorius Marx 270 TaxID=870435 RepID=A0A0C3PFE3_PISTI|nr:hypothetical protein M404DRAFT_423892 [Pisolithus tinctorius Marx 270]
MKTRETGVITTLATIWERMERCAYLHGDCRALIQPWLDCIWDSKPCHTGSHSATLPSDFPTDVHSVMARRYAGWPTSIDIFGHAWERLEWIVPITQYRRVKTQVAPSVPTVYAYVDIPPGSR